MHLLVIRWLDVYVTDFFLHTITPCVMLLPAKCGILRENELVEIIKQASANLNIKVPDLEVLVTTEQPTDSILIVYC